jgi:hypothetical protein
MPATPTSPTEKAYGQEEAVAKGILDLLKTEKKKIFSDLDDNEILNLSLLFSWGEQIDSKVIKNICNNFLELRVSKFRLGRREIINVASYTGEPERKRVKTLKDLFTGIR